MAYIKAFLVGLPLDLQRGEPSTVTTLSREILCLLQLTHLRFSTTFVAGGGYSTKDSKTSSWPASFKDIGEEGNLWQVEGTERGPLAER